MTGFSHPGARAYREAVVDRDTPPPGDRLAAMRVEYGSVEKDGSPDLDVDWLADGWLSLLHKWIHEAEAAGVAEPNAMVLATVQDGRPVTRSVLCKSVEADGVTFYTNYESAKGLDLAASPYASITFPWYALGRQVHVRGTVTKVDRNAFFRVELEGGLEVTAKAAGRMRRGRKIRINPGNHVEVEVSTYDPTRGRVVWRYR